MLEVEIIGSFGCHHTTHEVFFIQGLILPRPVKGHVAL
jgi:hypothetical protein